MKQNVYDDPVFFEGYRDLRANETGLNAAIEEPAITSVLPVLSGLHVLDLGCGFGDFCRFARKNSAANVVGVEISKRMIAEARNRTNDSGITYINSAIEDYRMAERAYDLVISRLALHYVSGYRGVTLSVYRGLRDGGRFVFSVEHPICTALCQGWQDDANGAHRFWPVDDYSNEGARKQHWFVDGVIKYHRTIQTYVNTLLDVGYRMNRVLEPQAEEASLRRRPDFADAARRPPLLVIAASKPVGSGAATSARGR